MFQSLSKLSKYDFKTGKTLYCLLLLVEVKYSTNNLFGHIFVLLESQTSNLHQAYMSHHTHYFYFPPFQFVTKSSMAVIALFLISFFVCLFPPIHRTNLGQTIGSGRLSGDHRAYLRANRRPDRRPDRHRKVDHLDVRRPNCRAAIARWTIWPTVDRTPPPPPPRGRRPVLPDNRRGGRKPGRPLRRRTCRTSHRPPSRPVASPPSSSPMPSAPVDRAPDVECAPIDRAPAVERARAVEHAPSAPPPERAPAVKRPKP